MSTTTTNISIFAGELVYCSNRSYTSDGIPLSFLIEDCPRFGWAHIEGDSVLLDNTKSIPISQVVSSYDNYRVRNGMGFNSWN